MPGSELQAWRHRRRGEMLTLSGNTIKTQAGSVYRKLGVSARSEAVNRMRELGLTP